MRILFLASGNGGTMKFVHQAMRKMKIDGEVVAIISDRECGAIDFARKQFIPYKVFIPWKEKIEEIVEEIKKYSPDIVVTNIHKILPSEIFNCCNAQFINLHYSLLPAFGGVIGFKTLEMARDANTRIIGATCHYVNENVDGGKIISQAAISVDWENDMDKIGNKIFRIACESILNGILIVSEIQIGESSNNEVIYSPKLRFDNSVFSESFWEQISLL